MHSGEPMLCSLEGAVSITSMRDLNYSLRRSVRVTGVVADVLREPDSMMGHYCLRE
jgi:hypothetical protein